MTEPLDEASTARLMKSLDDIDSEIARLALLCQVRILDPVQQLAKPCEAVLERFFWSPDGNELAVGIGERSWRVRSRGRARLSPPVGPARRSISRCRWTSLVSVHDTPSTEAGRRGLELTGG